MENTEIFNMPKVDLINLIKKFYDESELVKIISAHNLTEKNWTDICFCQKLSESLIEKYINKINPYFISSNQNLSEPFIEKYADILDWYAICKFQTLSEPFIQKHSDKIRWNKLPLYQNISDQLIKENEDKIFLNETVNKVDNRPIELKKQLVEDYAKKHLLKYENDYLYCFRNHDQWGRGYYNKAIFYDKPGIYEDWKCDLNAHFTNSYGFGIFPKGNTQIRVKTEWFGVEVNNYNYDGNLHDYNLDGRARVWKFELI